MPIIQTPDNERKETGLATSILAGVGSGLTRATLQAKKAGKYLSGNERLKRYGRKC